MTIDIDLDNDAEEIILVVDNHRFLRAAKTDNPNEPRLCKKFKAIEEEDDNLYKTLRYIVIKLFALE
ncbi:hypothetical protein CCP3SC5AM1_880002 [Gammaproteobacteria bacterium]